jgi:hypothetical protein
MSTLSFDKLPKILILDLGSNISDLNTHLIEENWLPTIDLESLLSVIFSCFINHMDISKNIQRTLSWLISDGCEFKEISDIQRSYINHVIMEITQQIYDLLYSKGFLVSEYFPYEFRNIIQGNSVVLSKIDNFKY